MSSYNPPDEDRDVLPLAQFHAKGFYAGPDTCGEASKLAVSWLNLRVQVADACARVEKAEAKLTASEARVAELEGEVERLRSFVTYCARCPECAGETECIDGCNHSLLVFSGMRDEARALLSPTNEESDA